MKIINKENLAQAGFFTSACLSILAVAFICFFLLISGIPAMAEVGLGKFLGGLNWNPGSGQYGIFPMIVGSLYVTAIALLIGVPIGILTAVFMACFCPSRLYKLLKPAVDLLAGIPSIVYGLFGLTVIVPLIRNSLGGPGSSLLAASIVLGIMILPTIIGVAEAAIRAVPHSYYEGSLALGASHEISVFKAVFPAAKSGVLAGVILGVGRAIGETIAVVMVAGNSAIIPTSILDSVRTMTGNIVLEMSYAEGLHREMLIATAVVLFVFILLINLCFSAVKRRAKL